MIKKIPLLRIKSLLRAGGVFPEFNESFFFWNTPFFFLKKHFKIEFFFYDFIYFTIQNYYLCLLYQSNE